MRRCRPKREEGTWGNQAEQGRIPWRCDSLNICEEKRPNLVCFPNLTSTTCYGVMSATKKDIHHFSVSGQERKMSSPCETRFVAVLWFVVSFRLASEGIAAPILLLRIALDSSVLYICALHVFSCLLHPSKLCCLNPRGEWLSFLGGLFLLQSGTLFCRFEKERLSGLACLDLLLFYVHSSLDAF